MLTRWFEGHLAVDETPKNRFFANERLHTAQKYFSHNTVKCRKCLSVKKFCHLSEQPKHRQGKGLRFHIQPSHLSVERLPNTICSLLEAADKGFSVMPLCNPNRPEKCLYRLLFMRKIYLGVCYFWLRYHSVKLLDFGVCDRLLL